MTVWIFKQTTVPSPLPGGADTITVNIGVSTNGTIYRWSVGGIPANTPDMQAYLNANQAQYFAEAQAAGASTMTQDQVNIAVYAWQHVQYANIFDLATYTLGMGMYNAATPPATPTTAVKRTVLQNVTDVLANNLSTTPFYASFLNERSAMQITAAISAMTDAQLATYLVFVRGWLADRTNQAQRAAEIVG